MLNIRFGTLTPSLFISFFISSGGTLQNTWYVNSLYVIKNDCIWVLFFRYKNTSAIMRQYMFGTTSWGLMGKRRGGGEQTDPSGDSDYVYIGKYLLIKWKVDFFHLLWPHIGCFPVSAACGVRPKIWVACVSNSWLAIRKTGWQGHISRINLLLQVMMPVTCHLSTDHNRETTAELLRGFLPGSSSCAAGSGQVPLGFYLGGFRELCRETQQSLWAVYSQQQGHKKPWH